MAEARPFDWRVLRLAALAFLAAKLILLFTARPFMDETYYWMWGQHPALSYFDHPPLIGWVASAASLLGWNIVGLRLAVLLTLIGDLAVLFAFARLDGERWRETFWTTALIFLATPIFFGLTSIALPDHLLMFFTLAALYAFERLRRSVLAGPPDLQMLYAGAIAVAFAMLSKYSGALLAVAFAVYIAAHPRLRGLFASPHLYIAALLALAMQAPVLVWNLQHGFASFSFLFEGRAALRNPSNLSGVTGFVLGAIAVLSPFLIWPIIRFMAARGDGHGLARIVFWLSTLGFLAASLVTNILIHWNVIAYLAMLPFLAPYFPRRALAVGQIVYGAVAVVLLAINYTALPVTAIFGPGDQTSAWSYGWNDVATEVRTLTKTAPVDFIAGTDYTIASPLAFALQDRDVASLSVKREAYDDWFDLAAHTGGTALIVADRWRPLTDAIRARFSSVEEVGAVDSTRFGRTFDRYVLYLGRGFAP